MRYFVWLLGLVLVFGLVAHAQDEVENLLENGGFELGIMAPWTTYGQVQVEVVDKLKGAEVEEPPIEGKYALYVNVLAKGVNFWDSGVQHPNHVFEKGKVYTLSVFLKSNKPNQINFKPELAEDPWLGFGEQAFTMTPEWKEYFTTTPPMADDVNPAQITFHVAYNKAEFWMDGARFYEGDYVPYEPAGGAQAVNSHAKLATLWGQLKTP